MVARNRTHKMSSTRIYSVWCDMKKRCSCPNRKGYQNYGGRGITYDPKWSTFEGFYEDMKEGYSDDKTLERKDVNGDYCKENCEWITREEQARNKRKYSNNTVGVAGVHRLINKGVDSLRARVQMPKTNIRKSKTVSLHEYTEEEAIEILTHWLEETRKELGYKESHGSEG